jgi:hypothetical protein
MSHRMVQATVDELTVGKVLGLDGTPLFTGYREVFSGVSVSETDADASVVITATGVLATDYAIAVMVAGATAQAVNKVVCTTNTVTVGLAGNGGAGTIVFYVVYRATA